MKFISIAQCTVDMQLTVAIVGVLVLVSCIDEWFPYPLHLAPCACLKSHNIPQRLAKVISNIRETILAL